MPKQISADWIDRQLELCENAEIETYWLEAAMAAHKNYPNVLQALQNAQGELHLVFSILEGLYHDMDDLPYENIKNCLASLVCAGSNWLEKESQCGNSTLQKES